MAGMHALHKILANCARPQRSTVTPGEFLEIEPDIFGVILGLVETGDTMEIDTDTFVVRNVGTGRTLQGTALPEMYRAMIQAGGEKPYLKARLAAEAARA